jgi:hypothetical protein
MAAAPSEDKPNLGPSPDIKPNPNSPFFMSTTEFQTVQCYIEAGATLPVSADEAVVKLGVDPSDGPHFQDLWDAYKQVQVHCLDFRQNIFPRTVNLAADLSAYGAHKVPVFYGALTKILQQIEAGTLPNDTGQKQVEQILASLLTTAQDEAKQAADVAKQIQGFIDQTVKDKAFLDPIYNKYKTEFDGYEGDGGLIAEYRKRASDDQGLIEYWNSEYRKDVTIACTTATYAWIFPAGTIAAAVVAGVYGARATEALKHVDEYREQLADVESKLRSAILMDHDLDLVNTSLDRLITQLTAALPIVQKVMGIWNGLAGDISSIITTIKSDVSGMPTFIAQLGVQEAIDQWKAVAEEADQYRVNAFVVYADRATIEASPSTYEVKKAA